MAIGHHVELFKSITFYMLRRSGGSRHIPMPNFLDTSTAEILRFFRFFKMAFAILDFQICEILLTDGVWRAKMHHSAKFP